VVEDGLANWPFAQGKPLVSSDGEIRVQWCTGAPGIVASAASYLDEEILLAGAELVWQAGPHELGLGEFGEIRRVRRNNAVPPGRATTSEFRQTLLVETRLGHLQPVAHEHLDRVGGPLHEHFDVLVGLEGREHVVRDRPAVAAARSADADP
jgi:hypothetical protein